MTMSNPRKSPRAQWIDYDAGVFFITICTRNLKPYFGEIVDGRMILSEIGRLVDFELSNPQLHHRGIEVFQYVVMPNHLHAIISIERDSLCPDSRQRDPNPSMRANPNEIRHVPEMTKYIIALKSAVTRQARKFRKDFGWHSRYHDHRIIGVHDMNRISEYIENNPINWAKDCYH